MESRWELPTGRLQRRVKRDAENPAQCANPSASGQRVSSTALLHRASCSAGTCRTGTATGTAAARAERGRASLTRETLIR